MFALTHSCSRSLHAQTNPCTQVSLEKLRLSFCMEVRKFNQGVSKNSRPGFFVRGLPTSLIAKKNQETCWVHGGGSRILSCMDSSAREESFSNQPSLEPLANRGSQVQPWQISLQVPLLHHTPMASHR